jgi:cob(I)alamin adenosyltransferase
LLKKNVELPYKEDMTRIYTRAGDDGTTALVKGQRIKKNDPRIQALGELDACNASIGMALSLLPKTVPECNQQLVKIQNTLFDLGAHVAAPGESKVSDKRFGSDGVKILENWIDQMDAKLPPLHAFILPGGTSAASALQVARCNCRAAERALVVLNFPAGQVFLNRLSDYLFVAARFVNFMLHHEQLAWEHE